MRKLILALCAIALTVAFVGCTDPDSQPKNAGPSSTAPAKSDGKTDS